MQTTPTTSGQATTVQPAQATPTPPGREVEATASATYVYEAARAVRNELLEQREAAVQARHGMMRELEDHQVPGAATSGMEQRIVQLDARIAELDKAIAVADAQVTTAASAPGAVTIQPQSIEDGPPRETFVIVPMVLLAVFLPMSIAYARRLWKRSTTAVVQLPRELMDRLARLEETGEATALEVERIGEGQRFVTRILTERGETVSLPSRASGSASEL